ncbi:hypothetical protein [Spongiimicrobium sp. 3-5]|uniref:hypothetical protein n=1 Tax=Spongiimicrobium sp. 3-5 TaxID=3332596 RepID=UPI00397F22DD
MRIISFYLAVLIFSLVTQNLVAQNKYKEKIEALQEQRDRITDQEKEALKLEIEDINKRAERGQISMEEAKTLKEAAAKKRALNIENRISIIDNKIALLERNEGELLESTKDRPDFDDGVGVSINFGDEPWRIFERKKPKYDRKTYSDFVFAIGLNNAITEGQSLEDSPYKIGGSRFFEMGWAWRTRIFRNSNFFRLNYGFSFQFNGLKPEGNQIFVTNGDQTELEEFEFDLKKSKLRMDNLVFPIHIEFGPSKIRETENSIRYSLHNQFRMGIGGYGGFNLGTRQKLKYTRNGESVKDKLKRGYNTSNFVYGLSAYAGIEGVLLYAKYDLSPLFQDAITDQHNISLGLRFDL